MIYLDNMATTPIDPRVIELMVNYMGPDACFANPASTHSLGFAASKAVARARSQIAALVGTHADSIIFTSGATESDNLALQGAAHFYQRKGRHIVTSKTEHKAVLDTCAQLERQGFEVTYLRPNAQGIITPEIFSQALREDTILASIMHVNNETGMIQDIYALGQLCRDKGIIFHVDAAQSAGKLAINLDSLPVDLMSFSAHKAYGPKGIGALYVSQKPRIRLTPFIFGGGHENGLRSGTLATHQIVGMGQAFELAQLEFDKNHTHIKRLQQTFLSELTQSLDDFQINGSLVNRVPHNLNISFEGIQGESLLLALRDLAISSASACRAASVEPSYVLMAQGVPAELAHSSIRFSFGNFNTLDEVHRATALIAEQINRLRALSL